MANIVAMCISEKKGTEKSSVPSCELVVDFGIKGDAHAGKWHRQVSLLDYESIDEFNKKGAMVSDGDFGENIIIKGLDFSTLKVGDRLSLGNDVILEITQLGKKCHQHCTIYYRVGDCIMPRKGIFSKVLRGGSLKAGDEVKLLEEKKEEYTVAVITLSDKGARGEREDTSGPYIVEYMKSEGYDIIETILLPDDLEELTSELIRLSDSRQANLILTTGGTGFSPRDITPEATQAVMSRNAPGIAEAMRQKSLEITDRAMLSRAMSVIRGSSLIINLPGSRKAVAECLSYISDTVKHGLDILNERSGDCGRK